MNFIIKNNEPVLISEKKLSALTSRAFSNVGFNETDADMVAKTLVTTDLMGISTHGVLRIEQYLKRVRAGVVQAQPQIEVFDKAPSLAIIHGGTGQGQVVANRTLEIAIIKAKKTGIGFISIGNSNHFGATAPYGLTATSSGVILICGTSASPSMAPFGGREPLLGNNPIGFSTPRKGEAPFILDMALSVAARGKMRELRIAGKPMPFDWALDAEGQPTTDPEQALKGSMAPSGGYKGFGIGLLVEVMAAALSGATLGIHASPFSGTQGGPPRTGQCFLALSPDAFSSGTFDDRIQALTQSIATQGEARLPGSRRLGHRQRSESDGVAVDQSLVDRIHSITVGNDAQ